MKYVERENGVVVGLLSNPRDGVTERLEESHPDIVSYRTIQMRGSASDAVDMEARNKLNDINATVTKNALKTAIQPFKAQFQEATTPAEVESVKGAAIAAIEAL